NMTYTPSNLNYNTLYNVIIANTAKDLAGITMSSIGWSFTTSSDTTPPAIIDNTPTGSNIPIASVITVTFNEAMNISSVGSAFSISPNVTGSFSWNGNKLTFIPALSLSYGTIYDVRIGSGAMDLAGNNMPAYTWQFTTENQTIVNVVQNPGFESGKTSWTFYTNGVGTFNAVTPGYEGNYSANLAFSSIGNNMQLFQSGIILEPNTHYRLSFTGKSTLGHDVRIRLIKQASPYTFYGLDYTANLGTDWAVFTTEFNTTGFTTSVSDARLQFYLVPFAQAGDIYNIDNVVLDKVG
ncbi:MAG: Ig-like domain-containing protein, partial [Candidatus Methanoperedens sp.]